MRNKISLLSEEQSEKGESQQKLLTFVLNKLVESESYPTLLNKILDDYVEVVVFIQP